jgi:hypothetical protein
MCQTFVCLHNLPYGGPPFLMFTCYSLGVCLLFLVCSHVWPQFLEHAQFFFLCTYCSVYVPNMHCAGADHSLCCVCPPFLVCSHYSLHVPTIPCVFPAIFVCAHHKFRVCSHHSVCVLAIRVPTMACVCARYLWAHHSSGAPAIPCVLPLCVCPLFLVRVRCLCASYSCVCPLFLVNACPLLLLCATITGICAHHSLCGCPPFLLYVPTIICGCAHHFLPTIPCVAHHSSFVHPLRPASLVCVPTIPCLCP